MDYSSKTLEFFIDSLAENIEPLNTERKLESRVEPTLTAYLGLLGLPRF